MENPTNQLVTEAKLEEALRRFEQSLLATLAKRTSSPRYFSTKDASRYLDVSYQYLEVLRCHGGGPPYLTLGRRMVRYLQSDLDAWAMSQRKTHTSQSVPGVCPTRAGNTK